MISRRKETEAPEISYPEYACASLIVMSNFPTDDGRTTIVHCISHSGHVGSGSSNEEISVDEIGSDAPTSDCGGSQAKNPAQENSITANLSLTSSPFRCES